MAESLFSRLVPAMLIALTLLQKASECRAQHVQFVITKDTPLLPAPADTADARGMVRLLHGSTVLIPLEPELEGVYVRGLVPAGDTGWINVSHLELDLSVGEFQSALAQDTSWEREPRVIGRDSVLHTVSHAGSKQAIETWWEFYNVYESATLKLQVLNGHSPIEPPAMRNFWDGDNWMLVEDLRYVVGQGPNVLVVPRGFVTDFASVPRGLRSILGPTGPYGMAAVIHDWLYWRQDCSRAQADRIFDRAMRESRVSRYVRAALYLAVRVKGGPAWDLNRRDRERGLVRRVPPPDDRVPANTSWRTYRVELARRGVKEIPSVVDAGTCLQQ